MALTAKLPYDEGGAVLSFDGTNAFNSKYRHRIMSAPAKIVPPVGWYASTCTAGGTKAPECHEGRDDGGYMISTWGSVRVQYWPTGLQCGGVKIRKKGFRWSHRSQA